MKKMKFYILLAIGILSLASCLVDGSWLGLVGRWQDAENESFELEFTEKGTFTEYLFGSSIGHGEFYVNDVDRLSLHYLSACGGEGQLSCDVDLKFSVTDETLIITDSQGDIRFNKVSDSE